MPITTQKKRAALRHLRAGDPVMRDVIRRVGSFELKPARDRFAMLANSILAQQISVHAARAIRARLLALVEPEGITPASVLRLRPRQLRSVGISKQKAGYLVDLARKTAEGTVPLSGIGRLSDERVIERLTEVKGIGRWSAQMFLIFGLGRLDVFPFDDLGIRLAIRDFYGLDDLPDRATGHAIAEPWRPYATVASWYCWRGLELNRAERRDAADNGRG